MATQRLASLLPWNWSDASSSLSNSERKRLKRRHVRNSTRDDQVARTSSQGTRSRVDPVLPRAGPQLSPDTTHESSSEDGYYPGLVNISGTYCFMNSTLQALASLTYLQPQLDEIHARAESLDVPTPVIDNLRELVRVLNTPTSSSRAHRPVDIIAALSTSNPSKNNSLFSSREHQDAQELFQLLSECIKNEAMAVAQEIRRDRGLSVTLTKQDDLAARNISKTVFDGLTANRRSCMQCGYTEAVMHFPFDNWQLALPGMVAACRLEECLEDYTRLELLSDCICRKCSMLATYRRLEQEADRLTEASQASNNPSSSKKKRARDTRKLMARVKAAIDEGRIEEDIPGVKTEKVFSQASTKQSMVARPPPVLALHLNRSIHYGHHATKNNARVIFPEILDLTPFTTSGQLSTQPSSPISAPPPPIPTQRSVTPTPSTYAVPRTLYRLAAVVCHYGQHSFGHYVCFRRKPRPPSAGERRFAPPKLACPLGCDCARCERYGPVRDSRDASGTHPGRGWLRISDDAVQECGLERVLQEGSGAFMLYYERVQQPRASPYTGSPRGSEETSSSRPNGNGDVARRRESRERRDDDRGKVIDPRVVRRTSAHRRPSAPPMMRTESSSTTATTTSKHSHHPSAPNGEPAIAPSSTTPRPPLSPTPSSKSGRLRKSRRSISQTQGDAHPTVASGQAAPPTSLRA
ncbi:cysteine proteinase [Trametes versicolor FP-101664 SS1]|uniref:cysteine proteinase n=1 Tax=Trametes versicolor (strain FP-101664) TaxID=717944 RepID=UPI0004622F64|nr:cysteine proteinase [Trametes versicolor FP-101664 SS1]EIW61368.1 cysteine proteinase [Trametes versicolor FP-101664 SS1]